MNEEAIEFWDRVLKTLQSAKLLLATDPDSSASRSYYAAFYAVSALFILQGKNYSKHSALEAAVHRDLVRSGRWSKGLGSDYSYLVGLRIIGDYGGLKHVSKDEAGKAIQAAQRILRAVHEMHPDVFALSEEA